ncbi:hypothetical protein [Lonsdalea populi]|uniref:hypothetical protein n=1 Tax=Lonsdalea populi TaxID=1172565 RepID=UPI000A24699F|nr:hypothetical protein [Lonsdalea populi]OSM98085.1 hypothetical protein AU508_04590 [Lonsdalea populi]RAT71449.1 hypothetical protein AU505_09015 [Lonsdalea populi]RAT72699.1 hypothetical protein AU504_02645 [Lonsdalea populi]RAT76046.1 hypothetical protein AU506_06805 [Lonsdalea populi]RAT77037.1 hypothetical protein AU507_12695 [Lonsdalea populi]
MAISGIETHSQNVKPYYPLVTSINVANKSGSSTADNTGGFPLDSQTTTNWDDASTPTFTTAIVSASDSTQSTDERLKDLETQLQSREAEQDKDDREEVQSDSLERSLQMMNGIPMYGGTLVSMISYPDGSWEAYDAFSGQPVTTEELVNMGQDGSSSDSDMFSFYSKGIYKGLSAAEIYEKIQQMMGNGSEEMTWGIIGSSKVSSTNS